MAISQRLQPADEITSASDRFYDPQHLWIRVLPAGRVLVGLDAMATRLLRDAEGCAVPQPGTRLTRGRIAVRLDLGGRNLTIASPVSGEVIRSHQLEPARLRRALRSSYTRAWLFMVSAPRIDRQLSRFLFGREAGRWLAHEWTEFKQSCMQLAFPAGVGAMPDGGDLDLDRLQRWAGDDYSDLVGRWIGARRLSAGAFPAGALDGETNPGGRPGPPESR